MTDMTDAPVPLAEQIAATRYALRLLRNSETPFTVQDKEALDAAAATLQQIECAMAVVEAVRAFSESTDANELGAELAMFDALAAFDTANTKE